ncbi:4Fe-4S dicluster domain-containing protein [Bacillus sp. FJAT-29790]|uniref:4Fe-4S dicluster domain-containing protein n=1 Tax=Bacillus sp. FJAT-29790 TaxID=1895002 RepID=UPI001C248BD6|nr:4Fe-4S dicluster domain-containing protein [Bacillus sp. FJAT-29790]MBU8878372.1 4Fe-4S dicluster domain-containing protein [Bacillus sp. FJAT-29790]
MSERVNRRQFLSINWEATVGFLGNFIVPQLEQDRDFFRPPGAHDELEFLTSCTRCGKCKESCPEEIISLFTMADGAKLLNTPYINPNVKPCTICEICADVCPTDALSITSFLEERSIGKAVVHEQSCIAFQEVMCDYCVRSCPEQGAIQLIKGKPVINEESCTGCGLCVASCISGNNAILIYPKES